MTTKQPDDVALLKKSIKKYRGHIYKAEQLPVGDIVIGLGEDGYSLAGFDFNIGSGGCPLCKKYLANCSLACYRCPIKENTGLTNCYGTPWMAIKSEFGWRKTTAAKIILVFQAEIDFLKTVLAAERLKEPTT